MSPKELKFFKETTTGDIVYVVSHIIPSERFVHDIDLGVAVEAYKIVKEDQKKVVIISTDGNNLLPSITPIDVWEAFNALKDIGVDYMTPKECYYPILDELEQVKANCYQAAEFITSNWHKPRLV